MDVTEKGAVEGTEEAEGAKGPTIEETATAQGWNPDYDGPDKIDAAEFVRRKPLFDKIKGQGRELKEVKKLMEGMANTFKAATEAQYKKGIADAEARMKQAEATFDLPAFKQASAEKQQLEQAQAAHVSAPAGEPAEVTEFCERNPWFEKDAAMRTDALDYRENYLKRNPGAPIADTLAYIEKKMARDYPDAFAGKPAGTKTPAAPAVEGAGGAPKVDALAKLKASMTGEEKRIMKMFVGEGKLTEAEYLKDYATVRGDK